MIATIDAENLSRLLKQLSRDSSTENTIAFVADNSGMLSSCKKILSLCRDGNEEIREWVQKECGKYGVQYGYFLQEAGQILQLFQSDDEQDDSYGILGLSSSASLAEVKQAYRKLTVQYHPDTAGNADRDTTEQFIQINKAYHTIITSKREESVDETAASTGHSWRYGKTDSVSSSRVSKKSIVWIAVLILGAVLFCGLIAQIYSQKVMVSTLQHSGAAFVPPAKKSRDTPPAVAMTFAEKMRIAETMEKAEQAARHKESDADHAKRADSVEPPELKAVKVSIPAEQEKTVGFPPQEAVQEIPSLSEVDSQATKPTEKVKKSKVFHNAETKAEISTVKIVLEDGETKNTAQNTKNTIAPDLKREDPAELRQPAAERIAQHKKQISIVPTKDVANEEVTAQPVVKPPQMQNTAKENSHSESDVQQRIDSFLSEYCRAYGEKNLMEFTRFFELDATENGKLISELIGTYTNLFESTKTIGLQISTLKWEESPKGQITLNGRFKIDLVYQNAEVVHGRGKIDFMLVADHGKLFVKRMNYSFDQ